MQLQSITAQQSRDARRELGLSQADVTKALDFNRQYLSEFETGFSKRFTDAQLRKLLAFYEDKITEANANGEEITLTFGEVEPKNIAVVKPSAPPQAAAPYRFIPVYLEADQPAVIKTQAAIQDNDARIAVLMQQEATRDNGFFGTGDFTEDTQATLQEAFSLMAANYALWRSLSGWPALGLAPSEGDITTVRDVIFETFGKSFEKVGLVAVTTEIKEGAAA